MSDGRPQSDPNDDRRSGRGDGPRDGPRDGRDASRDPRGRPDSRGGDRSDQRDRPDPRERSAQSVVPAPVESARPPTLSDAPDEHGRFGAFGGVHWPETVLPALKQIEEEYARVQRDRDFWTHLAEIHRTFVGRPTTLHLAQRLTDAVRARTPRASGNEVKGARIWLKREDLAHSGGHCINNAMGQALLAQRMGKRCLVAESANGQHGVAIGTVAANLGLEAEVFIGADDAQRQPLNMARMRALGVQVRVVDTGTRTFQDALVAALQRWTERGDAHYVPSSVVGAHPYPAIVRDFQSLMGRETKAQSLRAFGKLPDAIVACIGGGSAAAGMFYHFLEDAKVALVAVHAGGTGEAPGEHAAVLLHGASAIVQGTQTFALQDAQGQTLPARSCASGLQRSVVGPELAYWKAAGRMQCVAVRNDAALNAFGELSRLEGIIPSLESAHAVAHACTVAAGLSSEANLVVCLSGRGEKDLSELAG